MVHTQGIVVMSLWRIDGLSSQQPFSTPFVRHSTVRSAPRICNIGFADKGHTRLDGFEFIETFLQLFYSNFSAFAFIEVSIRRRFASRSTLVSSGPTVNSLVFPLMTN